MGSSSSASQDLMLQLICASLAIVILLLVYMFFSLRSSIGRLQTRYENGTVASFNMTRDMMTSMTRAIEESREKQIAHLESLIQQHAGNDGEEEDEHGEEECEDDMPFDEDDDDEDPWDDDDDEEVELAENAAPTKRLLPATAEEDEDAWDEEAEELKEAPDAVAAEALLQMSDDVVTVSTVDEQQQPEKKRRGRQPKKAKTGDAAAPKVADIVV